MRVLSLFLTLARSRGFSAGVLFLTEDPQALDKPKRNLQKGIVEFLTESALFREFLRLMTCLYGRNLENTKALRKSVHNPATEALGSTSSLLSEAPSPWALSGVQSSPPQFSFSVMSACGGWNSQTTPEPHVLLECGQDLFLDSHDCGGGLPAEVITSQSVELTRVELPRGGPALIRCAPQRGLRPGRKEVRHVLLPCDDIACHRVLRAGAQQGASGACGLRAAPAAGREVSQPRGRDPAGSV